MPTNPSSPTTPADGMTLACPPVREMLDALVGIDTTSSGSNLAAVDLVESWLESVPGFGGNGSTMPRGRRQI